MSLVLDASTPAPLVAKTFALDLDQPKGSVFLYLPDGERVGIPPEDMAALVWYWLTNTDLVENDARLDFLLDVAGLRRVDGYMPSNQRLGTAQDKPQAATS